MRAAAVFGLLIIKLIACNSYGVERQATYGSSGIFPVHEFLKLNSNVEFHEREPAVAASATSNAGISGEDEYKSAGKSGYSSLGGLGLHINANEAPNKAGYASTAGGITVAGKNEFSPPDINFADFLDLFANLATNIGAARNAHSREPNNFSPQKTSTDTAKEAEIEAGVNLQADAGTVTKLKNVADGKVALTTTATAPDASLNVGLQVGNAPHESPALETGISLAAAPKHAGGYASHKAPQPIAAAGKVEIGGASKIPAYILKGIEMQADAESEASDAVYALPDESMENKNIGVDGDDTPIVNVASLASTGFSAIGGVQAGIGLAVGAGHGPQLVGSIDKSQRKPTTYSEHEKPAETNLEVAASPEAKTSGSNAHQPKVVAAPTIKQEHAAAHGEKPSGGYEAHKDRPNVGLDAASSHIAGGSAAAGSSASATGLQAGIGLAVGAGHGALLGGSYGAHKNTPESLPLGKINIAGDIITPVDDEIIIPTDIIKGIEPQVGIGLDVSAGHSATIADSHVAHKRTRNSVNGATSTYTSISAGSGAQAGNGAEASVSYGGYAIPQYDAESKKYGAHTGTSVATRAQAGNNAKSKITYDIPRNSAYDQRSGTASGYTGISVGTRSQIGNDAEASVSYGGYDVPGNSQYHTPAASKNIDISKNAAPVGYFTTTSFSSELPENANGAKGTTTTRKVVGLEPNGAVFNGIHISSSIGTPNSVKVGSYNLKDGNGANGYAGNAGYAGNVVYRDAGTGGFLGSGGFVGSRSGFAGGYAGSFAGGSAASSFAGTPTAGYTHQGAEEYDEYDY